MARAGAVWVSVLPDMSAWSGSLRTGLRATMGPLGSAAGQDYGQGLGRGVKLGMGNFSAVVKAQADASAAAVREASSKVASARDIEAKAAGNVRVAEAKLQDLRSAGTASASQITAAEEKLAAARRATGEAETTESSAEARLQALRDGGKASAEQIAVAESKVSAARRATADAEGQVTVTEAKLTEIREKGGASSSALAAAEERLATAERAQAAAAAKGAVASAELADAQKASADASDRAGLGLVGLGARAETAGGKIRESMASAGKSILGLGALGAGVGLADFLVKGVENASKFQKSMNLLVTAGGEARTSMSLVSSGIENIATTTGTSLDQLAEGMYTVEKAGLRGADGLKVLKAAAEGAKDENVDLATMTNALTSVMRSYNLPASAAVKTMNEMVAASGASKTSMAGFAGALSTVMPLASAAHLSFAQVGGAIATLTSHGTSADEATQELSNTIRNLVAPNRVAVNEMAQFGIQSNIVATQIGKKGLQGTLEDLSNTVLQRMGPAGTVLLKSFNQSKVAAGDAAEMYDSLMKKSGSYVSYFKVGSQEESSSLSAILQGMKEGTISASTYIKALGGLPPVLKSQVQQYSVTLNKAQGFNAELRAGGNSAQTYNEAIKKMTGGATGLTTTLMLTGGSAHTFTSAVNAIAEAGQHAGKNISVWAQTQETFSIQMDRFRASVQVAGVQVGTALLPPLTKFVTTMANGIVALDAFATKNSSWVKPLVLGLGAAVVGITAMSVATAALNAVLAINPVIAVITGIAALSVITVEAYKHSQTFRDIVQDLGRWFLRTGQSAAAAGKQIATVAVSIYDSVSGWFGRTIASAADAGKQIAGGFMVGVHGIVDAAKTVGSAAQTGFDGFMVGVHAVAASATWLYEKGILPPFNLIKSVIVDVGSVVKWLWTTTIDPYFTLIYNITKWVANAFVQMGILIHDVIHKVLAVAVNSLWTDVVNPVFHKIADLATWLHASVFVPFANGVKFELTAVGNSATWLYRTAIKPAWDNIQSAALYLWKNVFIPWAQGIVRVGQQVGAGATWLWRNAITPAFQGIENLAGHLWHGVFVPFGTGIEVITKRVGSAATSLWHGAIVPAFNGVESTVSSVWGKVKGFFSAMASTIQTTLPKAFSAGVAGIKTAWAAVQKAAETPVTFVVHSVLNPLIGAFDSIAKAVGSKAYIKPITGFAGGGPIVGPGGPRDDQVPLWGSNGEFMINAKQTSKWRPVLEAINSDQIPKFAGGGPIGAIKNVASGVLNDIKGIGSDIWSAITNPAALLTKLAGSAISGLKSLGGSPLGGILQGLAGTLLTGLENKVKSFIGLQPAPTRGIPGGLPPGSGSASVQAEQAYALSLFPSFGWPSSDMPSLINLWNGESGWNPAAYNASSGATGIPQSLPGSKMASAGADWKTNPDTQIRWGLGYIKSAYGDPATTYSRWLSREPHWYDQGGYLPPGDTLVRNKTGKPEPVLTPDQWQTLRAQPIPQPVSRTTSPAPTVENHYHFEPKQASATMADFEAFTHRRDVLSRVGRRS